MVDLGLLPYASAYALQQRAVAARKICEIPDLLLVCEHPHVITLGRNGKHKHLLANEQLLAQMNVEFHETDRGGDVTYHGPGQLVGYPIMDLAAHRRDVRWYVQLLEEAMIRTSADFGVQARRVEGRHGLWIDTNANDEEKLAAIGVHLSRWVTSHGFAYNISTDLRYFDLIVPCGISGKRATSLERLLNRAIRLDEVRLKLAGHFGEVFDCAMLAMSSSELEARLEDAAPGAAHPALVIDEIQTSAAGAMSGD